MAHHCSVCFITTVQYANKVCAKCRNAGRKDLEDFKVQVVAAGELVDPRAVIDQQLGLLNEQQVALRSIMREEQTYRADLSKDLRDLTIAINHTLKEWRMHERDAGEHVQQLSHDEKRRVMVEWLLSLEALEQDEVLSEVQSRREAA